MSQPGDWNIRLTAQRTGAYDVNYEFNLEVNNAPVPSQRMVSSVSQTSSQPITNGIVNNGMIEYNKDVQGLTPAFDPFAWLTIGLSIVVGFGSAYYYKRGKQELRKTIEMLES